MDSPHAEKTLRLDALVFESLSLELCDDFDAETVDASQEIGVRVVSIPLATRLLKLERSVVHLISISEYG
jgi:hypothetical protein